MLESGPLRSSVRRLATKNKKGLNAPFLYHFLSSLDPCPSPLQESLTNGISIILYYRLSLPT